MVRLSKSPSLLGLAVRMLSNTSFKVETELIRYFQIRDSLELFFRIATGVISNNELKDFAKKRGLGWYTSIKNKISRGPKIKARRDENKMIVFVSKCHKS